jgi:hypothetical protein
MSDFNGRYNREKEGILYEVPIKVYHNLIESLKMKFNFNLASFMIGFVIAVVVSFVSAKAHYHGYQEVRQTNIGGIVIDGKQIYELVELSDPDQGRVRTK